MKMVRTVLANRKLERYVQKIAEDKKFSYGVIVGQTSSLNKDYVVHLAKTSEPPENYESEKSSTSKSNVSNVTLTNSENRLEETLENFDGQNLINHSISVTRMIPGSFYVLGIFVITEQKVSENTEHVNKFRNLFREIHRALDLNKFFCGHSSTQGNGEKLLLNYVWSSQSFQCKLYDSTNTNPTTVDWKFLDKPTVWHMFESSYELDEIFPIREENFCLNLENNFLTSLEYISNYIKNSEIFIQNENVDENQSLENYIKDKLNKKESIESFKASILQLTSIIPECPPTISEYQGTIRYVGTIYSRVWVHPKSSFKDIQTFIRNDILRSLAARIQIFCDGLTNPNAIHDAIVVNIPPKRVFFDIPDSGGIQFSEYIFNGENAHTVVEQAKDILDLTIEENNVAMDFEALPDYEDAISIYAQPSVISGEQQEGNDDSRKLMYYGGIGIAVAVAVLILSILLHFIWR